MGCGSVVIDVILDFLRRIGERGIRIDISFRSNLNMKNEMQSPEKLSEVQDTVWNDPRWKAEKLADGLERTHCNQASLAVANGMGCHEFDPPINGEPYLADQLYHFFQREASGFLEKNLEDVQNLANRGCLVFAVLPSWIMQQKHGHIVSITPGKMVESGILGKSVPVCLNIAGTELSSRSTGINWAFPLKRATPRFFCWKESL